MSPYREPPTLHVYVVAARVRGPLSELEMHSVERAQDAGNAIVQFVERMTEQGFDLVSEPRILNFPPFSLRLPK